ncbi:MarR family winged helix-turn-helix transcriptional regulator [Arthrobacter agilis]|uniref:MarR family winged helix-turn-helix transcriptional regulator n=1 Tax=Arthrobacter agilis TaxID=37921 RepID=UPI0030826003
MAAHWLTLDERRAWLALYALTSLVPAGLDAHLFREARITLFDYHVLAMLSESQDSRLPMSELAARSTASLSRLSHVVKKLEARGWVSRLPSDSDGRVTTASITGDGLAMLTELAVSHVAQVRALVFDSLDERDVADLDRVGRKILRGLDDAHWILSDSDSDRDSDDDDDHASDDASDNAGDNARHRAGSPAMDDGGPLVASAARESSSAGR